MASNHLDYVAPVLRVANLDRSLAYYQERLGFELEFNYENFYASITRDGCRIHLSNAPPLPRDLAELRAEDHIDACFGVHDIEALQDECKLHGANISTSLRSMPYGKEFYVQDPDGYLLAFVQPA